MSAKTKIEWCDSTINGSSGCDGCELWNKKKKTCYAGHIHENRLAHSFPYKYAPDFHEVRMIPGRFAQAAAWPDLRGKKRLAKSWLDGFPRMIFVGDMGDFLSRGVTDEFLIDEMFGAIKSPAGQRHFWLLLTKRPRRLAELASDFGGLPDNCMAKPRSKVEVINDLNGELITFYRCVRFHGDVLLTELEFVLNSRREFFDFRDQPGPDRYPAVRPLVFPQQELLWRRGHGIFRHSWAIPGSIRSPFQALPASRHSPTFRPEIFYSARALQWGKSTFASLSFTKTTHPR